ncbi:MAG: glycosyltransferase family 2 protein [Chloroflexi bacterium HGW-Chloroflexi-3]|nr:MAG: glycosyltransferase family 2 protein [Chloroflexi bacterium HGW-Chloroflexi-3]
MNLVSVIVPCYNEEKNISFLLEALNQQTYPHELVEIIIIDGQSTDKTLTVIDNEKEKIKKLRIKVITNPQKNIPSALNIGIRNSSGDIIVRMDAHSIPDPNYIKFCVEDLNNKMGSNVGGRWVIIPGSGSKMGKCISLAASHPFGVGDAKYRYSSEPGYVDTVPFGSFYRTLIDEIGYFNEDLLANEDYEFNVRIRNSGKKIYFDPRIKTQYISRDTILSLSKQYWRYGYWKFRMLRKYPDTIRWRQAIPPLFVTGIILLILMSIFIPIVWSLLSIISLLYVLILIIGTLSVIDLKTESYCLFGTPIAIIVMHFSWGLGFLFSLTTGLGK